MYHDDWTGEREERKAEIFPVLLTPAEVMEILGVGKNTIYTLLTPGSCKASVLAAVGALPGRL